MQQWDGSDKNGPAIVRLHVMKRNESRTGNVANTKGAAAVG